MIRNVHEMTLTLETPMPFVLSLSKDEFAEIVMSTFLNFRHLNSEKHMLYIEQRHFFIKKVFAIIDKTMSVAPPEMFTCRWG